jgi:hypothetical protein
MILPTLVFALLCLVIFLIFRLDKKIKELKISIKDLKEMINKNH